LSERQPIFNVPSVVVWVLGGFAGVHLLRTVLPGEQSQWLTAALAFIPARLSGLASELPGGEAAVVSSFVTHIFVHGDLTHLIINSAWLLAFGTPVARRTDTARFLVFFLLAGVAGALLYLVFNMGSLTMVVGASGAISGLMGAAFRFLFGAMELGGPLSLAWATRWVPVMGIGKVLRNRRLLLAVAGWTALNILLAWGAAGLTEAAGIAWEAHLGGFYMGLLTYGWFDRAQPIEPPAQDDIADAG
jgi:membrane associated rhomboid family serine protease